ncbi:MAG: WD40/YVTN/BNR-like repeat-containing protein [Fimbriimonadaceae bacterium]
MIGNVVRLSSLLVASLAIGTLAFAKVDRLVSIDVRIELKAGSVNESTMSDLSFGFGRVLSKDSKGFVLRLNDPEHLERQLEKLKGRRSVVAVEAIAPILPSQNLQSVPLKQLKQIVAEYKESYIEWAEATGVELEEDEGGVAEIPGLDFLEAYLQWKHDRAFPNEEIDISGYVEIANRRTFSNGLQRNDREFLDSRRPGGDKFGTANGLPGDLGKLVDPTAQWQFMGPRDLAVPYRTYFGLSPISGRANAVAFDPIDGNTFYTGGAMGGVWKTTDGGVNWNTTCDTWPLLGVSSLSVSPTNGNIVLAGTGDFYGSDVAGIGVMRSANGGQTWTRTGLNMGSAMVPGIVFDPDNSQIVYAVAGGTGGSSRGVYRSTDAGQNWSEVVTTDIDWSYVDIGAAPVSGPRLKWAVSGGSSSQILTSTNGLTWTPVTNPTTGNQNKFHIAASKLDPNTAYLLATTPRKIFKTIDAGVSWTDVTAGFPNGTGGTSTYNWSQGWYDYYIKTSVVNGQDMIFVGLIDVVMSINGGASWRNIGGTNYTAAYTGTAIVHQDNHNLAVDPNNPTRALVSTDGGVFLYNYNAAGDTYTWDRLSKNLGITQFYTLAIHPTNPDYAMGGTQDNSSPHSFGNLAQWGNPGAGDGAGCGINWLNTNIQYHSSQFHGLVRTTNAWSSSSGFAPSFGSDSVPFIGDLWLDPNDPTNVYVNTNYLWRYKEGTGAWTARLGGQLLASSGQVRSLGIAPGDSNVMYTGASNGDLYMSRDFGATWTQLDTLVGLPNSSILDVSVNPRVKDDILVATGSSRLFRITGTNTGTPTLTAVNGAGGSALPNVAINTIARDPWQPETHWYVGTDVGVFATSNAGANWTDMTQSKGLPNVQVSRLKVNATTGYMTAATYGRGMWRIKIIPAIIQSVVATPNSVISGDGGNLTVTIDRLAPAGGVSIPLTSNSASLVVPASVLIPAGANSVIVPFTTLEVGSTLTATVSGSMGGIQSATVQLLATVDRAIQKFRLKNATGAVGNVASIVSSDDSWLSWSILDPADRTTSFNGLTSIATSSLSMFRIEMEGRASVAGLQYQLLAFNLTTKQYVTIGSGNLSTVDQVIKADVLNASAYWNPTSELQVALFVTSSTSTPYVVWLDKVRIRTMP